MFIPPQRSTSASPTAGRARVRAGRVIGAGFVLAASLALLPQTAAVAADGPAPSNPTPVSADRVPSTAPTPPTPRAPQPTPPTAERNASVTPTNPPQPADSARKPGDPARPNAGSVTPTPAPEGRLAETGGSDKTAMLIGGGAVLLVLGAGTVVFARRRGRVAA